MIGVSTLVGFSHGIGGTESLLFRILARRVTDFVTVRFFEVGAGFAAGDFEAVTLL